MEIKWLKEKIESILCMGQSGVRRRLWRNKDKRQKPIIKIQSNKTNIFVGLDLWKKSVF